MSKYLDSLTLCDLFDAPQSFVPGDVRRQILARCEQSGISIGRADGPFTFTGDVDALVETIERHHRRTERQIIAEARPTIGTLQTLSGVLRAA